MTIDEISRLLQATANSPAAPMAVARHLERSLSVAGSMVQWGRLYRSLDIRFYSGRRRQFTAQQMEAMRTAADFGAGGGVYAKAFPNMNRTRIALQLMARVIDPSIIHQGNYMLCGPAAMVMTWAQTRPLRYVEVCTELADRGVANMGGLLIQPRQAILQHNTPHEADWIMCASLRDDDRQIQDRSYGGSSAEDMFNWFRNCGFQKVLLAVSFPLRVNKCHPLRLFPPNLSTADNADLARTMVELSKDGWKVVMFVRGGMTEALGRTVNANQGRLDMTSVLGAGAADAMKNQGMQRAIQNLQTENIGLLGLTWKVLTGNLAAHSLHLTFVDNVIIDGNNIRISAFNHGVRQPWVELPFVDFVNKFVGFTAASDLID